jgi:hypothetical protein
MLRINFIYLFIYSLTTLSVSQTTQRRMKGRYVNDKLERMWKVAVVAYFKQLSQYFPRETEEKHKKSQSSRSPCRDLNPGLPEYEAGVLTTRPRRSVPELRNKQTNQEGGQGTGRSVLHKSRVVTYLVLSTCYQAT